ncbi:MAG: FGGY family carbohydrate kinase [Bdellovibrionota bacterium]
MFKWLGHDNGTVRYRSRPGYKGTTALLFDANQNIVEKTYAEHRQHFPQVGWVEHDPEEIFENTLSLISKLLRNAGVSPLKSVASASPINARHSLSGTKIFSPVHPAIVWQCRRTSDECLKLKKNSGFAKDIQKLTGLTIDPYFSGTKLSWLLKSIGPNPTSLAFGTMDTWLIWNLTQRRIPCHGCHQRIQNIVV